MSFYPNIEMKFSTFTFVSGEIYNFSQDMGDLNRLSHFLARILRHEAIREGLPIDSGGYVDIDDILDLPEASHYTPEDVERVVRNDSKGRFKIKSNGGVKQIKATQGHTMQLPNTHEEMTPIIHWTEARFVIHGTRRRNLNSILSQGLSRQSRQHIHFATGETGVRSGMPVYCDTVIELDMEKAMQGGIKFYKSENGVILSSGNSSGFIPKEYFKRVYDRHSKSPIPID